MADNKVKVIFEGMDDFRALVERLEAAADKLIQGAKILQSLDGKTLWDYRKADK